MFPVVVCPQKTCFPKIFIGLSEIFQLAFQFEWKKRFAAGLLCFFLLFQCVSLSCSVISILHILHYCCSELIFSSFVYYSVLLVFFAFLLIGSVLSLNL